MSEFRGGFARWAHLLVDLWERVYRILKGLPHHRLALITVSVGAAILAGPVWEPYLRAFVEKAFGVKIDVPIEPLWGVLLIALGLGYHLAMTWIATQEVLGRGAWDAQAAERVRAHDVPIFNALLAQAPENTFKNALSSIINDHAYLSTQSTILTGTYYFLDTVTNKFNDGEVQARATTLERQLDMLIDFLTNHFSIFGPMLGGGVFRFCMEPQWNIDRGGDPSHPETLQYHALGQQLTGLVHATRTAYEDLIRTGHQRLL